MFFVVFWSFSIRFSMDQSGSHFSPSRVPFRRPIPHIFLRIFSPRHRRREFVNCRSKSPCHVTSEPGNLHSVNLAGQSTGRGSLQYQGTEYTIIDESILEQAIYLTQGDPLPELVSFPEALQLVLSRRFSEFASLGFDSEGQPQARSALCSPVGSLPGHHLTL